MEGIKSLRNRNRKQSNNSSNNLTKKNTLKKFNILGESWERFVIWYLLAGEIKSQPTRERFVREPQDFDCTYPCLPPWTQIKWMALNDWTTGDYMNNKHNRIETDIIGLLNIIYNSYYSFIFYALGTFYMTCTVYLVPSLII